MDRPPVPPLLLSLFSAILLIFGPGAGKAATVLVDFGLIILAWAFSWLAVWAIKFIVYIYKDIVTTSDPRYLLADKLTGLDPEKWEVFKDSLHLGIDVDLDGKQYLKRTEAPISFFQIFLSKSTDIYLCPNSGPTRDNEWHEGSDYREWATQITNVLVASGKAEKARGPFSARWTDELYRRGIAAAMGLPLDAPSPTDPGYHPYNRK